MVTKKGKKPVILSVKNTGCYLLFHGICCFFSSFFSYLNIILDWWLMAGNGAAFLSLCKSQKAYVGQQSMYRMSCKLECNALHIVSASTSKHSSISAKNTGETLCNEEKKRKSSSKERMASARKDLEPSILRKKKLLFFWLLFAKLSRGAETREHHEV